MAQIGAIVLAAGLGRRFGGAKLLATLEGRPILQHVLDALAEAGIDDPVVVVGPDAGDLEAAIDWRAARRVVNLVPAHGLASSLQTGWTAATETGADAQLIVLGDQPHLDPGLVRSLLAEPFDPARPIVAVRHPDGSRNPVRLEPEAAPLVEAAEGDRGMGPILAARPELVRTVEATSPNPDVDTPTDLAALIEEAWAHRVRENAAQVDRVREAPDGPDFYASVTRLFVVDPAREGDSVLDALLAEARPDETWLDIGAGAGRYALPLARHVREVVAIDPSRSMLEALGAGAAEAGIDNVRIVEGRWPPDAALREALGPNPIADVALIAHVGYDVERIEPFIHAMERAARRRCLAVLMDRSPATAAAPFWPLVHGEERAPLPALPLLVELLEARGAAALVTWLEAERRRWGDRDELLPFLRRQLWTAPGSAADDRLLAALDELAQPATDGSIEIRGGPELRIGLVSWEPEGLD